MAVTPAYRSGLGEGARVVVVTGAAGPLGRQAAALAARDPAVGRVVGLDARAAAPVPGVSHLVVDLATAELKPLFEGAGVVVHLAEDQSAPPGSPRADAALARRVLEAAGGAGVGHLVLLSSASVYGAWANNPVPLTEEAPLRPNPGAHFAVEKAELERAALDWRDDHPGSTVCVLRPSPAVGGARNPWLTRVLSRSLALPSGVESPPAQFLQLEDLASAIDLARRERLDGAFNVAPDRWISGDELAALRGGPPRLRLPWRLAGPLAALGWRCGLESTPPGWLPYLIHPWVVANDRLRAAGWCPAHTNEEAFVAGHQGRPWANLSPRRRQDLALGAAVAAMVALAAGAVVLGRRAVRRAWAPCRLGAGRLGSPARTSLARRLRAARPGRPRPRRGGPRASTR